jgi:hypothetical protein
MVKRSLETLKSPEKVAAFFSVSGPMLERRLIDLGLKERGPEGFLEAEAAIAREDSSWEGHGGTGPGPLESAEDLTPPVTEGPTMPRSFAASTYGQTARTTGRTQGMERIREIAMMLEKRTSGSKDS